MKQNKPTWFQKDGKVTNLMRHLMNEDSIRGEQASLVGHHEGAGHCQAMSEVVNPISNKIKVTCHLQKEGFAEWWQEHEHKAVDDDGDDGVQTVQNHSHFQNQI